MVPQMHGCMGGGLKTCEWDTTVRKTLIRRQKLISTSDCLMINLLRLPIHSLKADGFSTREFLTSVICISESYLSASVNLIPLLFSPLASAGVAIPCPRPCSFSIDPTASGGIMITSPAPERTKYVLPRSIGTCICLSLHLRVRVTEIWSTVVEDASARGWDWMDFYVDNGNESRYVKDLGAILLFFHAGEGSFGNRTLALL